MSGKGGNNRKNKHRFSNKKDEPHKQSKKQRHENAGENIFIESKFERIKDSSHERLRWTAPVLPVNPITSPDCPWCGKPIKEIATAISDKESGLPVHFDCVLARLNQIEHLETNDSISYIGGGRFGVIHYNNPPDMRDFTVKKIIEWEIKEKDYEWRRPISEYFSLT